MEERAIWDSSGPKLGLRRALGTEKQFTPERRVRGADVNETLCWPMPAAVLGLRIKHDILATSLCISWISRHLQALGDGILILGSLYGISVWSQADEAAPWASPPLAR
jgi:hypothetical protein